MSSIDQQFIEFIVKSIVSKPDAVKVDRRIDEKGVLLELTVDPEDLGRVIGKRGATAQSLRTLLRALGTKNDARYNLKIIDNGAPYERPQRDDYRPRDEFEFALLEGALARRAPILGICRGVQMINVGTNGYNNSYNHNHIYQHLCCC